MSVSRAAQNQGVTDSFLTKRLQKSITLNKLQKQCCDKQ